ncbi:MAG: ester cyclase [Gammaproteobacteria bacterium]|nr:ester cyclase [Gammaproteobacteria bacterium]
MSTAKEVVTGFINSAFNPKSTWNDVAQYAEGSGMYTHPILSIPSIHALFDAIVSFRNVFPDLSQKVASVAVADDDHIIVKTFASATFRGDFGDIKANGRRWEVPVFWEFELDPSSGKIISASELGNHHAINQQLGVALFKAPFEQE